MKYAGKIQKYSYQKRHQRSLAGSTLIDFAPALWILLMGLMFPLINLATVTIRANVFTTIAQDAARDAGKAKTFFAPLSGSQPSAVGAATTAASNVAARFSGITISSVNTYICTTAVSTGIVSKQSTALTSPANTTSNLYQIEVRVVGQAYPLMSFSQSMFGQIPGLTGPVNITSVARVYAENPQGLNQ